MSFSAVIILIFRDVHSPAIYRVGWRQRKKLCGLSKIRKRQRKSHEIDESKKVSSRHNVYVVVDVGQASCFGSTVDLQMIELNDCQKIWKLQLSTSLIAHNLCDPSHRIAIC